RSTANEAMITTPTRKRETDTTSTAAKVMKTLRLRLVAVSLVTYCRLIGNLFLPRVAVDAPFLIAEHAALLELDDAAPHGVDDGVVVRRHEHRRAGAVDPM